MLSEKVMPNWLDNSIPTVSLRDAFGHGLVISAKEDERIVALSANLMESVGFGEFQEIFGEPRCIDVGIAEQNLVTVASGLASVGSMPFAGSYAVFSPGRNWEQIRTTICLNNQPVKIVGSHAGLNVGQDGATHQMLEDIALMRSLPNMVVLAPADANEAELMAVAMAKDDRPNYVRLPRASMPIFLAKQPSFEIGVAHALREGSDIALIGTGVMTRQLLLVAEALSACGIEAEVVHVPTIKPLDETTILASAKKCGKVVTAEEGQIAAGFGSAVAELLGEKSPMPIKRIGVDNSFGESGTCEQLWQKHGLDKNSILKTVCQFMNG